jgi:hypothetical protein
MLKIEVPADSVRQITSKDGKAYTLQSGYVHVLSADGKPQPHPVRAEWFVGRNEQPAGAGVYLLAPASIYIDRSGRFGVAPKLVPVPAGK